MSDYCVVLTTCADEASAKTLAKGLLEKRLAACVQFNSIESFYTWQGEVCNDPEIRLVIKTRSDLYAKVETYIQQHHDYDVPQIVSLPIEQASEAYLNWLDISVEHGN